MASGGPLSYYYKAALAAQCNLIHLRHNTVNISYTIVEKQWCKVLCYYY